MKELRQKYRTNDLSPDELTKLREQVNSMTDEDLALQLHDEWMDDDIDTSSVSSVRLDRLKEKIDSSISWFQYDFAMFKKVAQMAAAVLLPVFILSTLYFYNEIHKNDSEKIVFSTGNGERANVILPDGTNVSLNSNSRLVYAPKTYNSKSRQITFGGEAYFQVHKNKDCPFLIDSKGLKVKVLGTVFNLQVRSNSNIAELALEQGCVQLSSLKSSVILNVGQKAVLDQTNGNIRVVNEKNIENNSAWKRGFLTFNRTSLSDVIKTMEVDYGVKIIINNINPEDSFTGTVPLNDLHEALLILENTYHLKSIQKGENVILYKVRK